MPMWASVGSVARVRLGRVSRMVGAHRHTAPWLQARAVVPSRARTTVMAEDPAVWPMAQTVSYTPSASSARVIGTYLVADRSLGRFAKAADVRVVSRLVMPAVSWPNR
jgi:hypothetical protein